MNVGRSAEHRVEQASVQQALEQCYRRTARDQLEVYLEQDADGRDVESDTLELRNQRTTWGCCSSSGPLGIEWPLITAPPGQLVYVVVHELANNTYWSFVAEFGPDYEEHADWLDENGTQLVFTLDDLSWGWWMRERLA